MVLGACRGQVDGAGRPLEQRLPEIILQQSNLTADRPLRDVQLLGSKGKAQVTGSGLKGKQAVERRKRLDFHGVYDHSFLFCRVASF
ncbi:hypothetical protein D3C85_1571690 [compost metagenome]